MSGSNSELFASCLKEVVTVLGSGDDLEALQRSSECHQKTADVDYKRVLKMKRCVAALAKMKEQGTKSLKLRLQENKEKKEIIVGLRDKKDKTTRNNEKLSGDVGSVEEAIRQTEEEAAKVREEKAGIQHETVEVLPKNKSVFVLYSNITRLRWDYEVEDDKLKGFVVSLRDVRPFALDIKQNSKYFIANYLWDIIETA